MGKLSLGLAVCAVTLMTSATADPRAEGPRPVRYQSFKLGNATYHSVIADLQSDRVSVRAVHSKSLTSSWNLVKKSEPVAALTGTFFAPSCGRPVADVLVDGELVAQGQRGSVVAIDWFGKVHIFDTQFRKKIDWFEYRYAVRGAVRIMTNGKINPNPKAQKISGRRIWGRAARTAAGTTRDGKLVLLATPNSVTLSQLAAAARKVGVVNAVALDGGGSTCLYYRGSMVIKTQRKLSNMLVLHEANPRVGADEARLMQIQALREERSMRQTQVARNMRP